MGVREEEMRELERLAKIANSFLSQIENISAMMGFGETGHEKYWTETVNDILDDMIFEISDAMRR